MVVEEKELELELEKSTNSGFVVSRDTVLTVSCHCGATVVEETVSETASETAFAAASGSTRQPLVHLWSTTTSRELLFLTLILHYGQQSVSYFPSSMLLNTFTIEHF